MVPMRRLRIDWSRTRPDLGFSNFIAEQSARPKGFFGRLIFGPYLDRVNAATHQLVYQILPVQADSRVLEVGFGGGELMLRIAARLDEGQIDGVELSPEMIAAAQVKASRMNMEERIRLKCGSVENLPYADASFDLGYSVHTLYFWPSLEQGIAELARVIRPGGCLVLAFSSAAALIADGIVDKGFAARSRQQVIDACCAGGFEFDRLETSERPRGGLIYLLCCLRSQA